MASSPTPSPSFNTSIKTEGNSTASAGFEANAVSEGTSHEPKASLVQPKSSANAKDESTDGWVSENEADESDSDSESNPDEEQPSYHKLLEWWRKTNSSSKDLKKISKSLIKIKKTRTLDWKREMKEVISNVNGVLQLRDELHEELEEEEGVGSDDEEDIRICLPRLHFVPSRFMSQWRHSSNIYAAIDIPSDKTLDHFHEGIPTSRISTLPPGPPPNATPAPFPPGYSSRTWQGPPPRILLESRLNPAVDAYIESYPAVDGIPDRIRINSIRLQLIILEERKAIGDNVGQHELPDSYFRLFLYRPFKVLYYLEGKIRDRLRRYEQLRKEIRPDASEEEFQQDYHNNPVSDICFLMSTPGLGEHQPQRPISYLTADINDLRCLVQFIDLYLVAERNRIRNIDRTLGGSIRLPDLWYVFPVGSMVYCRDDQIPQKIWRVAHTFYGRKGNMPHLSNSQVGSKGPKASTFYLDCYYLEYDGTRHVPVTRRFQIHQGWEPPQHTHTNKDEVITRGKRFIEYATTSRHLYYTGRSLSVTPDGEKLPHARPLDETGKNRTVQYSVRVDSPVMIDYTRVFQEVPWWRPGGSGLNRLALGKNIVIVGFNPGPDVDADQQITVDSDHSWDLRVFDDHMERESKKWRDWEEGNGRPEGDDYLLFPGRVFAFVFRTRKWACLQLGNSKDGTETLNEIIPRAEPWTDLELPEGHKEVVQSLITWHFKPNKTAEPHFDLVRDKGKGVIILLHGVPGVGKTSTAECAAESHGRPLFPITCGDLGLTPQDVEAKLEEIFRLAQAWGCILLLDEADVFLAQRTASDIHRNSLVSVFLRTLEHYEGILFLTTNRVGVFDEAFKSRIHISLYYPSLDHNQTYQIWQNHITKALEAGIQVNRDELINFAAKIYASQKDPKSGPVWNGRQIRNAFQSALALAGFHAGDGQSVRLETQHFQKVFNVSDKFSNYIWRVRQGHSDSDWNRMNMVRRDDFDYVPPTGLDVMNNMVPPGPYGMYPGGQARFGGASTGAFQQSTFGQGIPAGVFGIPQQQSQPSMQPQMAGMFGFMANPFQQLGQAQFQQPAVHAQATPTVNLQGQQPQPQPQATQTQPSIQPTQYCNPFQAAQFGQTVAQHTMHQQQQQHQPQQQSPFLQQDGNHPLLAPQAQSAVNPTIGMQPQAGVTTNMPLNSQVPNQTQQSSFGSGAQQQGVGTGGFAVPDANASQQQ
ncbi:protein MSP1 [Naviculisporaceae sp. PSN 640]